MKPPRQWSRRPSRIIRAGLLVLVSLGAFFYPAGSVLRSIFDPALNQPGVSVLARQLHYSLAGRYAQWAMQRVAESDRSAQVAKENVAGTEWPLYGSVFYLWAEEALQAAWEKDHALFPEEPRVFARPAIEAAARLVADPQHAAWVKQYWGAAYLEKENLFYRMLLIAALGSHRHLTGSDEHLALLRAQTDSLTAELAASPAGLLDDYPGQCWPTDVISAWAAIQRADAVLGTDHAREVAAAVRGFSGQHASILGLPPGMADARDGRPHDVSRGCSNSNACMLAPALWPATAAAWYGAYERNFWQRDWLAAGFRDAPLSDRSAEWSFEIDAGPIIRGNGFAACAFGIAAARANGRFDHAYVLAVEAAALSWPLPGGRLLIPRLVSNTANAPYLGEAALMLQLATQPVLPVSRHHAGALPAIVFVCLALYLAGGALLLYGAHDILRPRVKVRGVPAHLRDTIASLGLD